MKLKHSVILDLLPALRALDGHIKIIKDGGQEKAVHVAYTFTAEVRYQLAANIRRLSDTATDFSTARDGIIRELADGGVEVPQDREVEFSQRLTNLMDLNVDVDVIPISRADLNLERNSDMPPSIIARLMPIMDLETPETEDTNADKTRASGGKRHA